MHDNITIFRLVGNGATLPCGRTRQSHCGVAGEKVRKGDVVVARLCSNKAIMHRVKIKGTNVTLLGDGNLKPEHCHTA